MQIRQEPPNPDLVAADAGSHSEGFAVSLVAHWYHVSSSEWPEVAKKAKVTRPVPEIVQIVPLCWALLMSLPT